MAEVLGVDGARDGWIAVRMRDGVMVHARPYSTIAQLLDVESDAAVVAIDIPIGLPAIGNWPRRADKAAKSFIGPLRSSVFVVAPEEVMKAPSHADAVALCARAGIGGLSQQAYALRRKIFEVAAVAADRRVHEVHPEVSFAAMAGRPLTHGKRTWDGYQERCAVLAASGVEIPPQLRGLGRASVDDVLDAAAAAWSATRIAQGSARTLPEDAAPDEPRIWY